MNVFADSSVLVEHIKGSRTDFIPFCASQDSVLHINSTVVSEFLFHIVAIRSDKSPLTIKRKGLIPSYLDASEVSVFLRQFSVLSTNTDITSAVPGLMVKHNLLPNDALILATCLWHRIPYLASYDVTDFASACAAEGVVLLSDAEDAKQHFPSV